MTRFKEDQPRPSRGAVIRSELRSVAELAGLVGFAVVQPVLGPFGESPESFTASGAGPGDIVAFAAVVALVPVVVVALLASLTRLAGERVRSLVQSALIGLLAGAAATAFARQAGAGPVVRALVALVVAGSLVALHRRWDPARLFLRYTAPVPVFLVLVFLFASPVAPLVRPTDADIDVTSGAGLPHLVVVVLDELPTLSVVDGDGGIDADLVPNLARLADRSTWYRNHTAASPATGTSLPVLLTGQLPDDPGATVAATSRNFPDTLITLLARTHEVNGAEWVTDFCPPELCSKSGRDLDEAATALLDRPLADRSSPLTTLSDQARSLWWSQVWPPEADFEPGYVLGGATDADDLSRRSLEFLSGIDEPSGDRPVFDYLHSALPHQPWSLLPSGRTYEAPDPPFGAEFARSWPSDDTGTQLALAGRTRHLLQLQWADRILGAIIDRLEQVGRWDDAVVVVTSDHGVGFTAGASTRDLTAANQVEIAWAPLLVKLPGQESGAVVDDVVTALDVLPTIADAVGIEVDWELDGRSLLDGGPAPDGTRPFVQPATDGVGPELRPGIIDLATDGLAAITGEAFPAAAPGDELRAWRHGRHGDLLGRRLEELGVCEGTGPPADLEIPERWSDLVAGTLPDDEPLPLWLDGVVPVPESIDVAAVVDGRIAGWGVTRSAADGGTLGILMAEPLVADPTGAPSIFEIVDEPGCRLRLVPT